MYLDIVCTPEDTDNVIGPPIQNSFLLNNTYVNTQVHLRTCAHTYRPGFCRGWETCGMQGQPPPPPRKFRCFVVASGDPNSWKLATNKITEYQQTLKILGAGSFAGGGGGGGGGRGRIPGSPPPPPPPLYEALHTHITHTESRVVWSP